MVCALCLQPKALCNSHILPEFLYGGLYDAKHTFEVCSIIPESRNKREQKGLRELLLCFDCEQLLSAWEGYGRRAILGGVQLNVRQDGRLRFVAGLDYEKFRLFQLSILWRASVSHHQFFEKVKLGPHEELIRQLLLSGDPGQPNQYGCIMFGIEYDNKALDGLIVQPQRVRVDGHNAYKFIFGGFLWLFHVSNHSPTSLQQACMLHPTGNWVVMIRRAQEMENLANFAADLRRLGRAPKPS